MSRQTRFSVFPAPGAPDSINQLVVEVGMSEQGIHKNIQNFRTNSYLGNTS